MDRPATSRPATAREIILEIVRNMREGLEPLHYSTLAPSIYDVYLHPVDFQRLRPITPKIVEEARLALDAALGESNRASLAERFGMSRRSEPKIAPPPGGWQIRILENTDDDVEPGDIVISSELAVPAKQEFGSGVMTKRIATRRIAGAQAAATQTYGNAPAQAPPPAPEPVPPAAEAPPAPAASFGSLTYEDNGGRKTFFIVKDEIVVGRGGRDYWTDVKLETLPDVSREHFRLRRDETGQFHLKDLSRLGTTINGEAAPCSLEMVDGEKRDRNLEVPVPTEARIGLAGVIFLEFRSASHGQ